MSRPLTNLENVQVARVYADALWALANKAGMVDVVLGELDGLITQVADQVPAIGHFLGNATVNRQVREHVLERGLRGRVSDLVCNFVLTLNRHNRLSALREVRYRMHELHNRARNIEPVAVLSAVPLTPADQDRLIQMLNSRFGIQPFLQMSVDPSILGGLVVRIGDRVYDYSVRAQLRRLRDGILTRSSYEIRSR